MAIPSDLMVRAGTPGTARSRNLDPPPRPGAHRAAGPIERISRPDPFPRDSDAAPSPLGTGKVRVSVAREDLRATRILSLPGDTQQAQFGDAASIRFLVQILGQDLKSAQRPSIHRDSAALGSDAYLHHGGEPAPFPARAAIFRFIV